jgi:hypothetical protein
VPIALDIVASNAHTTLELSELLVTKLNIQATARSMTIALPAHAGQTSVNIQLSAPSLIIRIPAGVAAHIRSGRALTTAEIDLTRFPMMEQEGEYRSAGYETAENRVEMHLEVAGRTVLIG